MNALKSDLVNHAVVMDPQYYEGATDAERTVLVLSGFGARVNAPGTHAKVFWILDGLHDSACDLNAAQRLATAAEVEALFSRLTSAMKAQIIIPKEK